MPSRCRQRPSRKSSQQLKASGTVSRGWLGVKIQNVDEDTAASIGLSDPHGALVSEVTPNGPAATAGLKTQDAILQVNNDKIADSRDLARKIAELSPDTPVDVKIWRNNAEQSVKVKLGLFPKNAEAAMNGDNEDENGKSGEDDSKPSSTELSQLGLDADAGPRGLGRKRCRDCRGRSDPPTRPRRA